LRAIAAGQAIDDAGQQAFASVEPPENADDRGYGDCDEKQSARCAAGDAATKGIEDAARREQEHRRMKQLDQENGGVGAYR